MVELQPPDEKSNLRRFSLGIGSTYRLQDGVIQVDDSEHVERFKELGFTEVGESEDEPVDYTKIPPDLEDQTHDELKAVAKDLGIADDIDLRSKSAILEALQERD